jgi:polyphosphate kinase
MTDQPPIDHSPPSAATVDDDRLRGFFEGGAPRRALYEGAGDPVPARALEEPNPNQWRPLLPTRNSSPDHTLRLALPPPHMGDRTAARESEPDDRLSTLEQGVDRPAPPPPDLALDAPAAYAPPPKAPPTPAPASYAPAESDPSTPAPVELNPTIDSALSSPTPDEVLPIRPAFVNRTAWSEAAAPLPTTPRGVPLRADGPAAVKASDPVDADGGYDGESLTGRDGPRYSDRELSWLAFNRRVLDLAKDRLRVPLLERAKFLAIFASNLDEFFMVRVGGLKRRIAAGVAQPGTSGLLPRELHEAILSTTRDMTAEQGRVFTEEIRPELGAAGIHILHWAELTDAERVRLDDLFRDRIFPILNPLAVDPSHPFPYVSGRSLNLAIQLRNPQTRQRLFARVKVPNVLPRFYKVSEDRFVPLEDIITSHLGDIFVGMTVLRSTMFRVMRNEDVEVEEDDAENLLFALEKELEGRRIGRPPVRLEIEEGTAPELLDLLVHELGITQQEVFMVRGPVDLTGLFAIADVDREDLKYPGFLPKTNPQLAQVETARPADLFAALKKGDVLLHHPYDSFATSVQRFIEQAAADPQVKLIRQTLYRTSGDSPIVDALIEAARAGKEVLALVEIKARFDERANIGWARKLEKSGVHVVYGMIGLKTHCKLSEVIREEGKVLRRYCHIGTGNYNPKTARLYEDMGLLTANPVITDDVHRLFNNLAAANTVTGMTYRRLLVSPHGIRAGLIEMIDHEIALQRSGTPGRVRIKVNSIVDEQTMDALYRASQAGVQVDLWVRGICAVRAGIPGLSENIRVRSILGRFLEHSRLFWFDNGGHPQVGIGSADLMHRNLDRRVEVVIKLTNDSHIAQIGHLFDLAFDEAVASWWLTPTGWDQRTTGSDGQPLIDIQQHLITEMAARQRGN